MPPRSYKIRSDGRDLIFTPGPNGSLQDTTKQPPEPLIPDITPRAKVIMPAQAAPSVPFQDSSYLAIIAKKRAQKPTIVSAPRG